MWEMVVRKVPWEGLDVSAAAHCFLPHWGHWGGDGGGRDMRRV